MNCKKIAFAGKAGSGKTTAANYLVAKYNFKKIAFAEPLYEIVYFAQDFFGFPHFKWREMLQFLGKSARKFSIENNLPDPVLKIATEKIIKYNAVVIDDLRMKIEYEALQKLNFKIVRIVGREHDANGMSGGNKNDITEINLDDVVMDEIVNDGSIDEFYLKIQEWIEK
jgi:hypothetical protein